jgi:hypothetical protein
MRFTASLLAIVMTGCATLGNGPMQRVRIESEQPAAVHLENCGLLATKSAVTPATVWVSRRSTQCRLIMSMPGEEMQTFRLVRHVSRNMKGYGVTLSVLLDDDNWQATGELLEAELAVAAMMVPGFVLDFATGSMFELSPSRVVAERRP